MPMNCNTNCCVFGCTNSYKNTAESVPKVQFYKFPFRTWETERRKKWITFVKRQDDNGKMWHPYSKAVVCSAHFIGNKKSEDPRSPSFVPSLHPTNAKNNSTMKTKRYERYMHRESSRRTEEPEQNIEEIEVVEPTGDILDGSSKDAHCQTDEDLSENMVLSEFLSSTVGNTSSTQVGHKRNVKTVEFGTSTNEKEEQEKCCGPESRTAVFCGYETIMHDESSLRNLTSVSLKVFELLLSLLPKVTNKNEMSWENRLLLFLIKLKTNSTYLVLGTMFSVSPTTASNTFKMILSFLFESTREWIIFPSKQAILKTMPNCFKDKYHHCRVIIDCTEIKSKKPKGVDKQILMYSQYKATWTVKFLVGITTCGYISFISKGYGGKTTDSFLTTHCGILDNLEYGDIVLADKGFPNIQIKNHAVIVMPPFSKKYQKQFTETQMAETYKIASVRIHVERAIQRLKIFNILKHRVTVDLLPMIDKIFHICAVLVNLQPPIIKPNKISE